MTTAANGSEISPRPTYWREGIKWNSSNDPVIVDWERVRRQIEHEDVLINHRIIWLVQTNAMLLAAFGGVYLIKNRIQEVGSQATQQPSAAISSAESRPTSRIEHGNVTASQEADSIGILLLVLIVFGLLLSFITLRSVKMANAQIERLVEWWKKRVRDEHTLHPRLVGEQEGLIDRCLRWGYVIPMAFFVLWFGIGFAAFYNFLSTVAPNLTRDWIYGVIIGFLLIIILRQTLRSTGPSASSRSSPRAE